MRLGIISDVHSNIEALHAVHNEITRLGCDSITCLGDVIGYGPSPNECVDFLREHNIATIKGNHDHYVNCPPDVAEKLEISETALEAINWTREELRPDNAEWLKALPFTLRNHDITFIHAAIDTVNGEYWPYIFDAQMAAFHFYFQKTSVAFFGHIHVPLLFSCHGHAAAPCIHIEKLKIRNIEPAADKRFLINPGSVGQPRNADNRACALIFNTDTLSITPIMAEYDVFATCKRTINAGLPEELAFRLIKGC